jgi:hypothetical protein
MEKQKHHSVADEMMGEMRYKNPKRKRGPSLALRVGATRTCNSLWWSVAAHL